MRDIDNKAMGARGKKATFGIDIDLDSFESEEVGHEHVEDLNTLAEDDKQRMLLAGVDAKGTGRAGTFIQEDTDVIHVDLKQEGLEIMPIKQALKECDWIRDYYWKLVAVDTDKYTARVKTDLHNGYVIRALPGSKVVLPVQACMYIKKERLSQHIHNIVIAEEGSELHMITGCATAAHIHSGLHIGVSEFYVKKNAKLSFTMIHLWGKDVMVRARSAGTVAEGGLFLNNYISMNPAKSIQSYPTTYLTGKGATARFYSLLAGSPGCEIDIGGRVVLQEEENRAEIISRAITNGGDIIARGDLIGEVPGVKAHLECRGLILNGGSIHAIPELTGKADGVEMSHEAAVGKIAQEEILYLMSRGLSEDEAISTIVRGFMNVDIPGLPPELKAEIDRAVELSDKDVL
jgi:Fe-S cluster assembly scaffold protein SufB